MYTISLVPRPHPQDPACGQGLGMRLVCNHHGRLTRKVFSQNLPSNFNLHYFNSHTFLTGWYPRHHSSVSKQQGKNKLHHILCATQYKFHRFLTQVSAKCRAPRQIVHTFYSYLQKCLPDKDILLKPLSHSWNGLLNGIKHYTAYK